MKRTGISPGSRKLQRRASVLKPVSAKREAAGKPQRRTQRDTGPTPKVRKLVLERDGYRCTCGCGQSIIGQRYSLGHRLRASQGGQAVPSNLLTFLGWGGEACHGRIDSRRDPRDEANGLTVRSWQDPAQIPVMIASEDGPRVPVWLWDDGGYHLDGPQEVAA